MNGERTLIIGKLTRSNTTRDWVSEFKYLENGRNLFHLTIGTSTSKEAKEYFSDMARHRIRFRYAGQDDDSAVDLAFSKKKIEERKEWLTRWMQEKKDRRTQGLPEEYLYNKDTRAVSYSEFINKVGKLNY